MMQDLDLIVRTHAENKQAENAAYVAEQHAKNLEKCRQHYHSSCERVQESMERLFPEDAISAIKGCLRFEPRYLACESESRNEYKKRDAMAVFICAGKTIKLAMEPRATSQQFILDIDGRAVRICESVLWNRLCSGVVDGFDVNQELGEEFAHSLPSAYSNPRDL